MPTGNPKCSKAIAFISTTNNIKNMTNFTNNLNKQLFQELDDKVAANLSGGKAVLYEDSYKKGDFSGRSPQFFIGTDDLGYYNFDNKTSAIKISKGEKWNFYSGKNKTGKKTTLGAGSYDYYDLKEKGITNDSISSLKIA
jgi:Beta/Gamma crystallin